MLLSPAQQGPSGVQGLTSSASFERAGKRGQVIQGWWDETESTDQRGIHSHRDRRGKVWKEIRKRGWQKRNRMKWLLVLSVSQGCRTSLHFRAGSQTLVLHKKDVDLLDQVQKGPHRSSEG